MEFSPIFKTMLKKPLGPGLLVLQLAITIAIASNAASYIEQRTKFVDRELGFNPKGLAKIAMHHDASKGDSLKAALQDLNYLKAQNTVESAIIIKGIPMTGIGASSGFSTHADGDNNPIEARSNSASIYEVSQDWKDVLGVKLLKGRDFYPSEYEFYQPEKFPRSSPIIISEKMAHYFFPEQDPIGKTLYAGRIASFEVIGVMRNLMAHMAYRESPYLTVISPKLEAGNSFKYMLGLNTNNTAHTVESFSEELQKNNNDRVINDAETMMHIIDRAYRGEYATMSALTVILFLLIAVNALGIVGLTSFWVSQRRKHIGIRRALGANRLAIARYFLIENVIISFLALTFGALIAIIASMQLTTHYHLAPMNWTFIPLVGTFVLLIALFAALYPALKAAQLSPAEATRSL